MRTRCMHRRDAETQRKRKVSGSSVSAPLRLCGETFWGNWLPDMDLNHDKQIQSLLCYRYTIGQAGALNKLEGFTAQSSRQTAVPQGRATIAHGFNRGLAPQKNGKPRRGGRGVARVFCRPFGTRHVCESYPRLKPWAIVSRAFGARSRFTFHVSRI